MNDNQSKILDLEILGDNLIVKDLDYDGISAHVTASGDNTKIVALDSNGGEIFSIDKSEMTNMLSSQINEKTNINIGISEDHQSSSFQIENDVSKDGPMLTQMNFQIEQNAQENYLKAKEIKIVREDCDDEVCSLRVSIVIEDAFQLVSPGLYQNGERYYLEDFTTELIGWDVETFILLEGDHEGKFLRKIENNFEGDLWQMGTINAMEKWYNDGNLKPLFLEIYNGDSIVSGALTLDDDLKIYRSDLTEVWVNDDNLVYQIHGEEDHHEEEGGIQNAGAEIDHSEHPLWGRATFTTDESNGLISFDNWIGFYGAVSDAESDSDAITTILDGSTYQLNRFIKPFNVLYHAALVDDGEGHQTFLPANIIGDETPHALGKIGGNTVLKILDNQGEMTDKLAFNSDGVIMINDSEYSGTLESHLQPFIDVNPDFAAINMVIGYNLASQDLLVIFE